MWSAQTGFIFLGALDPNGWSVAGHADPTGRFIPGSASKPITGQVVPVVWIDGNGPWELAGFPQNESGQAWGVSWDGSVVGGAMSYPGFKGEGFLWTAPDTFELLGTPPGATWTGVDQLPELGDIALSAIIWGQLGSGQEGARWTRTHGWEALGDLPGGAFFSNLGYCSRDGRVGGGRASPPGFTLGARWVEATGWESMIGAGSAVVSGDGWTLVGPTASATAWTWNPIDGTRPLQDVLKDEHGVLLPPGWTKLTSAEAIADNGRYIAGIGLNGQGKAEGFLVEIPPFCYADCDRSSGKGVLDLFDFLCFVSRFNAQDPYGNCDNDGAFDLFDFLCFINHFNAGCP